MKSDFNPIKSCTHAYFTFVVSIGWLARTANTRVNWSCRQSSFTLTSALLACFAKLKFPNMHAFSGTCSLTDKSLLAISDKNCSSICLVFRLHYHAARGKVAHKPRTNTSLMNSNFNPIRSFYNTYFTFTASIIQQLSSELPRRL